MPESDQPSEIVIQLGQGSDASLRDMVEVVIHRAYPHTSVKVYLSGSLEDDIVHVVGTDGGVHADAVRRFIAQARRRTRRAASF